MDFFDAIAPNPLLFCLRIFPPWIQSNRRAVKGSRSVPVTWVALAASRTPARLQQAK
jgi:hypothetical protein